MQCKSYVKVVQCAMYKLCQGRSVCYVKAMSSSSSMLCKSYVKFVLYAM